MARRLIHLAAVSKKELKLSFSTQFDLLGQRMLAWKILRVGWAKVVLRVAAIRCEIVFCVLRNLNSCDAYKPKSIKPRANRKDLNETAEVVLTYQVPSIVMTQLNRLE